MTTTQPRLPNVDRLAKLCQEAFYGDESPVADPWRNSDESHKDGWRTAARAVLDDVSEDQRRSDAKRDRMAARVAVVREAIAQSHGSELACSTCQAGVACLAKNWADELGDALLEFLAAR